MAATEMQGSPPGHGALVAAWALYGTRRRGHARVVKEPRIYVRRRAGPGAASASEQGS